jgi:tetratricopeptide (TPR) repeat protein
MKKIIFLLLASVFCLQPFLYSQDMSWRKHRKTAEKALQVGDYEKAGKHFRAAWAQKPQKKDLVYQAGDAFFLARDYENAAEAYRHLNSDIEEYPLVGYKYGKALKQQGQYEAASRELANFIASYSGEQKEVMEKRVENAIRGCELGMQLLSEGKDPDFLLEHLNEAINTASNEFAPIPFNEEILYFSSDIGGRAQLYRSQHIENDWTQAMTPPNFPVIDDYHYCHGTLTPDNKRFYFTICSQKGNWDGLESRCDLYVIQRIGNTWSPAQRLRDYVNAKGSTTTHPHVVFNGNTEVLYFSSDREGGEGGLDLWYMTRDINSQEIDFTFPVNLGPDINTEGDEISPAYDLEEATLYFASNGHVTMGGFDIFMAAGSRSQWNRVENAGLPINSSADDYFFTQTPSREKAYIVSNRMFDPTKKSTTHDDIFQITYASFFANGLPVAEGTVFDETTGEPLKDVLVEVYEFPDRGKKKLIGSDIFPRGIYSFTLRPNRVYQLVAEKKGYIPQERSIDTGAPIPNSNYGVAIFLQRVPDEPPVEKPNTIPPAELAPFEDSPPTQTIEAKPTEPAPSEEPEPIPAEEPEPVPTEETLDPVPELPEPGTEYVLVSHSKYENYEVRTSAPAHAGTYYKIQLSAVSKFDANNPAFKKVREIGRLDAELLVERNLTRVMLGDFFSLEDARSAQATAAANGFSGAYIVKYENGERHGRTQ